MKKLALIIALAASPVAAQENDAGTSLMEEGAKLFLRGLMNEMEPALDDLTAMMQELGPVMEEFTRELGPALSEMLGKIDDIRHYEQPEFLPNGDIIIRRKPDAPDFDVPELETPDEIDI